MTTRTQELTRTSKPLRRKLGLILALIGAALIFATAVATRAHAAHDASAVKSEATTGARTKEERRSQNPSNGSPMIERRQSFEGKPLMLLDVNRMPRPANNAAERRMLV